MKKLTNAEIQDITGDIEIGLSVYIHKEKHNLISIHDDYDPSMTGEEDPDFDEIQKNRDDYFCIEKMGSSEAFRVMSGFAKNIKNRKTREKLFEILERRSPFRNFRAEVESDPKYRTDWFDYRTLQNTLHVREQLSEYFELEALPEVEYAENEKKN